jgi:hypothetical protein
LSLEEAQNVREGKNSSLHIPGAGPSHPKVRNQKRGNHIKARREPCAKRMLKPSKERKWKDEVFFSVMSIVGIQVAFVKTFSYLRLA